MIGADLIVSAKAKSPGSDPRALFYPSVQ